MQREIGSNFWIAPKDLETEAAVITPAELGCGGSDFAWLSTGRSAISFVLEEAGRQRQTRVWRSTAVFLRMWGINLRF